MPDLQEEADLRLVDESERDLVKLDCKIILLTYADLVLSGDACTREVA